MYSKDFSHVLFPGLNREFVDTDIEELDGAVACSGQDLILVCFGPGEVKEGVLRVEPWHFVSF